MQEPENLLDSDDVVEVRREAVERLKGVISDDSIGLLLKAMKDVSWRVRKTAVDILLDDYPIEAYINGLIDLLYIDDNAGARNSAIETLIKLDKKTTLFLIEAFNTQNRDVRKFIIDVLGEFRDRRSLPLMLEALKDEDNFVCGGATIYRLTIGKVDTLYITHVHKEVDGDTFFPEIDKNTWQETEREDHGDFSFVKYIHK